MIAGPAPRAERARELAGRDPACCWVLGVRVSGRARARVRVRARPRARARVVVEQHTAAESDDL